MSWEKLGRVYEPTEEFDWMETHAQLPVATQMDRNRYRVFFSGRNEDNMSQVGYLEIDITEPTDVLTVTEEPVLELGPLGTFDDSGVYPSAVVQTEGETRLYYIGWMQGKRVSYYASVGLARSYDGGETFEKNSRGPHLARNDVDPYMTLSSDVRQRADGTWEMWYTSATTWEQFDDGYTRPNYHIRYATSPDGLDWEREGTVCIDYQHEGEWAIARPSVQVTDSGYEMWYSYATEHHGYRIGHARSDNGRTWNRHDEDVGIDISAGSWDSELLAYPYVVEHKGEQYMFYNGNDYGREGFGVAKRT